MLLITQITIETSTTTASTCLHSPCLIHSVGLPLLRVESHPDSGVLEMCSPSLESVCLTQQRVEMKLWRGKLQVHCSAFGMLVV